MSINLLNPNPYCPKFISYSCQAPSPKATTPILILPVSQLGKCNTKANQISFGIKNLLQKRSENCIYNEHVLCFVYRWWKCTWAWQRSARSLWMAAVSMASIAAKPRRIGKENIYYISKSRWASSWHNVVFEGLSRRTAGAGAGAGARAAGAEVARGGAAAAVAGGGAMRTRVQGTTQG